MCDAETGITTLDDAIVELLRETSKPVFLEVNKVDNPERMLDATEFYSMGFDHIFFLSSISGSGTGELLDELVQLIPEQIGRRGYRKSAVTQVCYYRAAQCWQILVTECP